ncbi:MAG: sensor histidine kinase, partial [Myxococcota bacterium]
DLAAPTPPEPGTGFPTVTSAPDGTVTVSGLPLTVKLAVERDGERVEARTISGNATVSVPTDLEGLKKLAAAKNVSDLLRIEEVDITEIDGTRPAPALDPARAERLRDGLERLRDLGILSGDAIDDLLAAPPGADPALLVTAATVAWWPPLQADIEARTGIPLQVGGAPPRARAILPGHRLAGVPVWSLPTPETEATIDLFDGGTLLWLVVLTGVFGWELVAWRRSVTLERDRQSARDGILQRLSHELRTPAASVRSLVDALDLPGTTEAERQQFRDLARSEAERLSTGIDRLLQAARGDATLRIDPVPLDLAAWAEAVRARWSPRLPGLLVQAAHPSPAVADPERLDEAVDALLDNARKYGGPNVTLTVAPDRIVVEDDGEGIPAKDRARVAQKFERMEGRVNDPGGHGLGLWAVAEVARAHGGKLAIDGPSRFVVTLSGRRTK